MPDLPDPYDPAMTLRWLVRAVVAALVAVGLVALPQPASACACGAMVTTSNTSVSGETALVVWDGTRETISMAMELNGSAEHAAWVMPVPPNTDVTLGDRTVFPTLVDATKPVERTTYDWNPLSPFMMGSAGGAPGGAPPVDVEKVAAIGPFQVTWLTGSDASAVNTWLSSQGYPTKPALTPTFQTYLAKGWRILAVKLLPSSGSLSGTLDPLAMSFSTTEPVYPILLSKHANHVQGINLYVAAAHRMDIAQQAAPNGALRVRFAGRVPASVAGLTTGLGTQTGSSQTVFLTAYSGYLQPQQISGDYLFKQAATDDPYVSTVTRTVWLGWVIWLAIPVLFVVGVVVAVVGIVRSRRPAAEGPVAQS